MKKITAFIEVYNEEKRLPITLKYLRNFDEVVVFDKSSSDNTVRIAKDFGAKVYGLPYFDGVRDDVATPIIQEAFASFKNEWAFEVTCSDIYHPMLLDCLLKIINSGDYDVVEVPLYRYSMGFVSKFSCFSDIQYQRKLFKASVYDWSTIGLHEDPVRNAKRAIRFEPDDRKIAIYHLTHENLELVIERHLRYAKVEAQEAMALYDRKEYLEKSWKSIFSMIKLFIRKRVYKLGDKGKAQVCMLILYRCANFLNLYFDRETEEEIHKIYEDIRNGALWKIDE